MLRNFRANAGLDTKGAQPPGSWENATGYLRGHFAGHFMSMLAQAYAGTGDVVYKQKLDYIVAGLAACQEALAAAARQPTPRVPGRFGTALRLTGSPLGHAEHVSLPDGIVSGLDDFTIATWINLSLYDRAALSDPKADPAVLNNGVVLFDFGSPNPEFGEAPRARMFLTVRVSNNQPVPRFAITTSGSDGEQRIDGTSPLPTGEWTHVAVTRRGPVGTLYVNGAEVGVNAGGMTLRPADLGMTTGNWIGRGQFPQRNVSYLNASVDEFAIYNRALSDAEIRSLMGAADGNAGNAGDPNVAWYRFDETGGPEARDSSAHRRHARIVAPTDGRRHAGFLSAYPETQFIRLEEFAAYGGNQGIWAPYYTLHKILAGLLDAHQLAGNTQALDIASKIADWVHSRLAPLPQAQLDRMWNTYIAGEYGGINDSLALLASLRPGSPYLETAKRFVNNAVYQPVVRNEDILDGRHANQHIPQFIGYLRMYEQSDVAEYHTAAEHFWDMVVPHRVYSHGGVGVVEVLRKRGVIAGSLYQEPKNGNHAETCPLYNMLKLSRNLFFHDPDPKYMNYYEQGLFNQILGSRRDVDSTSNPLVTYFVPVRPGQRRTYGNIGTCCGGTGMENHTKYQDSIYFRAADGSTLYVNLYIPSTLTWAEKKFTVTQATNYPLDGRSTLTITSGSGPLDLKLRVPAWVRKGYTVAVNGTPQKLVARPGTYVTISRHWRSGDTIEIAMPMSFRTERALDNPAVQSVFYGPTLLAVQHDVVGQDLASGLLNLSFYRHVKLDGDLAPAMTPAGAPLHFTTNGHTLAPFFVADPTASAEGRAPTAPYHIYVRRHEPQIVFGSIDAGVPNSARQDGLTFLDVVWDAAPFATHRDLVAAVTRTAGEWQKSGRFTTAQSAAVVAAAGKAEADLRVLR
jgi:DUF1680 family protein